ncbi:tripartite tricarboxylate transporter TctB family protein [Fulvimarina sp. MAC8]|uniref:tripartite tricarboxylate transporter TctB family protein n=1 Tax=Fulvimarina sp. MAC8 TaxID=3162874 RepID=UPI0032ED9B4D
MGGLTQVNIDFSTSHLVFPIIIGSMLALMGLAILLRDRRRIAGAGRYWADLLGTMDKLRFFGTIVITVVYFMTMDPIGYQFPNTGLGFLITSIPYVFLVGVLYLHHRTARALVPIAIMALVAPVLVWWLFTNVFYLTLP